MDMFYAGVGKNATRIEWMLAGRATPTVKFDGDPLGRHGRA
jgi:hypothetical protein